MHRRILLHKRIGATPLEAISAWKARHPRYRDAPMTYAGRLDPMASGLLLILIGDECKEKERYTGLDKEYVIEVLLDIGTDTGDVLGMPETADKETHPERATVLEALEAEPGTHVRAYPPYSSKTVAGKPLFQYALEGALDTIEIPRHEETVRSISLRNVRRMSASSLAVRVASLLALAPVSDDPRKLLGADFRIGSVRPAWESLLAHAGDRSYAVLTLRVRSTSGAYMRSLSERIGTALGTRAFALSIRRTRIGRYSAVHTFFS